MAWVFGDSSRATIVGVVCPHCRERQARARRPAGEKLICRACHVSFDSAEGRRLYEQTRHPKR